MSINEIDIPQSYLEGFSLLIVEDDKKMQELYRYTFDDIFKTIHCAGNGIEGLEYFHNHKTDIIITDYMMPGMDGLDMIKAIRADDNEVPIILVTAIEDVETIRTAINLNVTSFLNKPIIVSDLMHALENAAKNVIASHMIEEERAKKINHLEEREAYTTYQEELAFKKELNVIQNDLYFKMIDGADSIGLIDILYHPIDILCGDSYSIHRLDDDRQFFLVVDAMGKGVSASLTATLITSFVNYLVNESVKSSEGFDLDAMIRKVLTYIQHILHDEEILSAHFVVLDQRSEVMTFASFSMPAVLMMTQEGVLKRIRSNNPAIDKYIDTFKVDEVEMSDIQKLLLVSDGVIENSIRGDESKLYMDYIEEDFLAAFTRDDLAELMREKIDVQEDDVTLIFIHNVSTKKLLVAKREFPTVMAELDVAREWYEEELRRLCKDSISIENSSNAFFELIMNAYEHGNLGIEIEEKHTMIEEGSFWETMLEQEKECRKKISVELYKVEYREKSYCLTAISDEGEGFDTAILYDILYRENRFNGRGIIMSKQYTKGIYYNHKGNKVVFVSSSENHNQKRGA